MNSCPDCGGSFKRKDVKYEFKGTFIGKYPADVCIQCGVVYYTHKSCMDILDKAEEMGLLKQCHQQK